MIEPNLSCPPATVSEPEDFKLPLYAAVTELRGPLTCVCGHRLRQEDMITYRARILRGKPGSIYVKTSCPKCQIVAEHYVRGTA